MSEGNETDWRAATEELASALRDEDASPDPGRIALLLSAAHNPCLDVNAYTRRLDSLAERARKYLGASRSPARAISAINRVLFEEERLTGNTEDYYNPSNSFLNDVLDTRFGIPISLSIVYLAVAWRLRKPVVGVGLPLHFIVKYGGGSRDIFIDPFHGGRVLSIDDCQERVERAFGGPIHFQESYLQPLPLRSVIFRMLNNLKLVYLRHNDYLSAARACDQMIAVMPDAADELRDRGLIACRLGRQTEATGYLSRYLQAAPEAPDAEHVRHQVSRIYKRMAQLN